MCFEGGIAMKITKNPILSGFYPDPSVCGVMKRDEHGKITDVDYYLVNSSFGYAPGVPIFHSKNLQDWTQLGHVLERPEQLKLDGAGISEGIYAPTLRYHNEKFYMISTNVSGGGNFYVTADAPQGPWSEPVYLENAPGIDPSLYFEGDTCYYVGQRTKENAEYFGDCEIWMQELDPEQGKLTGGVWVLWDGFAKHAIWPEGPHLYQKGDYYYLLIAEGGTEYSHSICVARSRKITGPYEPCPNNPIFTHRHLGHGAKIQNAGHGDLIETPEGDWYMVMLATRPMEGYAPLGRETFLAEVAWEDDWPVINPGVGMLQEGMKPEGREELEWAEVLEWTEPLDLRCLFYGNSERKRYAIKELPEGNWIELKAGSMDFGKKESLTYIGIRVTAKEFSVKTRMGYCSQEGEEAGLVYLYDERNHVKLVVRRNECREVELWVKITENGVERCVRTMAGHMLETGKEKPKGPKGHLEEMYELELSLSGLQLICKANGLTVGEVDVRKLTSEGVGGFVGCTMGIYAGSENADNKKAGSSARFSGLTLRY